MASDSMILLIDQIPAWWAVRNHPSQTPPDPHESAISYREKLGGLWTTLLGGRRTSRYVLISDGQQVGCGFTVESTAEAQQLASAFSAIIPGTQFRTSTANLLQRNWAAPSVLDGVPAVAQSAPPVAAERLLAGMRGKPFMVFVEVCPRPEGWVRTALQAVYEQSETLRFEQMRNPQSPLIEEQLRQMGILSQRYRRADRERLAGVFISIAAQTAHDRRLAEQILAGPWGSMDGQGSLLWRQWTGEKRWNVMLASELVEVAHFPMRSYYGYQVTPASYPRTAILRRAGPDDIALGDVLEGNLRTGEALPYPIESFFSHALISGSPGSGKTTAALDILAQLQGRHHIPFLVIEPAVKREFRALAGAPWAQPLQLFSIGEPDCALRINLLEPQGVPLATHLGHVRSLLLSAFAWVPPQQYILERALLRVYEDRGFDLVTGQNSRGVGTSLWPTLSDLEEVIPRVVREIRYDAEISLNLIAGLRARISMLTRGPLGSVLNTRKSTRIDALLASPAIVELALLGDDEQKCLLMGVLWIAIAEHRMATGAARPGHILVIEEAHRLLRNADTSHNDEIANARGQALETIANLTAELRAFNQGMLVIEQSPSQLHPSVLATTNLKIVLRTAGSQDRNLAAAELNLDEAQKSRLLFSPTGRGIVLGMGMPGPYEVLFPPFPQAPPAAARLAQSRAYTVQLHRGQPSPLHRFGFDRCGHSCQAFPEAEFAKRIQTVTLTALLAVAAGDEPTAIAEFMAENLSAEEPEHVCCIVQSTTDSFVRQKGIVGHLDLGREDEIAALWYTLARSLAIERRPHSRVVDFVRALQISNRAWGMPPAHRISSECHPDCRAWYEARQLASVCPTSLSTQDALPRALSCFKDAARVVKTNAG